MPVDSPMKNAFGAEMKRHLLAKALERTKHLSHTLQISAAALTQKAAC